MYKLTPHQPTQLLFIPFYQLPSNLRRRTGNTSCHTHTQTRLTSETIPMLVMRQYWFQKPIWNRYFYGKQKFGPCRLQPCFQSVSSMSMEQKISLVAPRYEVLETGYLGSMRKIIFQLPVNWRFHRVIGRGFWGRDILLVVKCRAMGNRNLTVSVM